MLEASPYDANMAAGQPFIIVKLDTKSPIEIGTFVSEFTSVSSQYEKFIKEHYPHLVTDAGIESSRNRVHPPSRGGPVW
jgi:hypothetical protein